MEDILLTCEELPVSPEQQEAGVIWRRRYQVHPHEQVTFVYRVLADENTHRLMAEWTYPDTQPLYFDRFTTALEHDAVRFDWEAEMTRRLLSDLTHIGRSLFAVRGEPWPECMRQQATGE